MRAIPVLGNIPTQLYRDEMHMLRGRRLLAPAGVRQASLPRLPWRQETGGSKRVRRGLRKAECPKCGAIFLRNDASHIFCSRDCAYQSRMIARTAALATSRKCDWCGREFSVRKTKSNPSTARFCGHSCGGKSVWARKRVLKPQ
jgi:hypothetical protein